MGNSFSETLAAIKAEGKSIVVVGLGVTGVETARFLHEQGILVRCTEKQSEEQFNSKSKFVGQVLSLRESGIAVHFGVDGEQVVPLLKDAALVVLSPGVPLESSVVGAVKRLGVPYVSELELGVEIHGGKSIVVTGSNGKSTTVTLIDHLLKGAGVSSFLCGNVGTPVLASEELRPGFLGEKSVLVVEASSYQLEACTVLSPNVSVILNISENHLERHGTLERYTQAKARAVKLQKGNQVTVLNADDPMLVRVAQSCRSSLAFFGCRAPEELSKLSSRWASVRYISGEQSSVIVEWDGERKEYDLSRLKLLGKHNRCNVAASLLAVRALGVLGAQTQNTLLSFRSLDHRLEPVGDVAGATVINDSKSTTVAASLAAFVTVREHYVGRPIFLMIGGLSKAGSWDPLLSVVARAENAGVPVVCFGKDAQLLSGHCKALDIPYLSFDTLQIATREALALAMKAGGVVLLSPGCASFDQFLDFEDRGRVFKGLVREAGDSGTLLP